MAWSSSWLGSWVSNWLGVIASSGSVTAYVTPSDIVLNTPAVVVQHVTVAPTTHDVVTLSTDVDSVTTGAVISSQASIVTLNSVVASIQAAANVVTTFDYVTLHTTPAVAYAGATGVAAHDVLTIINTDTGVAAAAFVNTLYDYVTLDTTPVNVIASAFTQLVAVDVTINSVDVKVYDYNDIYQRIEATMVKVYAPEILAFSTDITTDMEVVDAMETDMESIDGTQSVKLLRKTDNVVLDIANGTAVPENQIFTFNNALIRQIGDRDNRAVKQLRLFMQSVQNDDFYTMDTIIELPMRDDVQILSGDQIQADLLGTVYTVIAVDTCTLKTRWRVGARRVL